MDTTTAIFEFCATRSWAPFSSISAIFIRFQSAVAALLAAPLVVEAVTNPTPPALNPFPQNLIPQAPGGPTLYYNGSGPVPPINLTSPLPNPITPLNRSLFLISIISWYCPTNPRSVPL